MLPLPTTPFEIVTWAQAKVARDCHVQVQSSFYSIPWRYVGQTLDVRDGHRGDCSRAMAGDPRRRVRTRGNDRTGGP